MTELIEKPDPVPGTGSSHRPRPALIVAVVVVVLVLIGWVVAFSPVLVARSVTVPGPLRLLTAQQIRTAAEVPSGTPLIRLDTAPIRARVEALPEVASARVGVSYPSTVSITVTERVAVGYLSVDGGFELVDKTGTQFVRATAQPTGLPNFELAPGADPKSSTMASAQVAAALPADIRSQLMSISAGASTAVSLVLRDGRVVRWGSADRNAEKAQLLIPLLKQPGNTIDLSDPNSVVVS